MGRKKLLSISMRYGWVALLFAFAPALATSCSQGRPNANDDLAFNGGPGGETCATPATGCPCTDVGEDVECGVAKKSSGDFVTCSMGTRTCLPSGTWGECTGDLETRTVLLGSGVMTPQNLATAPTPCPDPCDPYCQAWDDTPDGIDLPPDGGLELSPEGLTLSPTGTFDLTTCSGLVITPSSSSLTVTSLSPVSPDTLTFQAALVPAGCYPGTIAPIWTVDEERADSVTISGSGTDGTLRVVSPIAGPVTVRAYMGPFVATATAQINVDVVTAAAAPSYAASFPSTTGTADSLTILYPYANTVFPLGLAPPIPQWRGASAANAVKVTLRYVNGATTFSWAAIAPENAPLTIVPPSVSIAAAPRFPNIPANAWFFFERSAKGQDAQIVVQRIVSNTLRTEVPTTVRFANGQLKGSIYYQSYGTQLARNFSGGARDSTPSQSVFPGGAFGAATLAIRPGAAQPTVIAGSTGGAPPDGSGTYCRVCHTASSDGNLLITQKFGGGNLASQRYSNLAGVPAATDITATSDGRYAWAAIFPTGGVTSGFLFGNAGVSPTYSSGPPPGGLDASNATLTSALYSLANGSLGASLSATYRSGGTSPTTITIPSSQWGLKAAVPSFSSSGQKITFQHHAGRVCATGSATQCTADERTDGIKQSIAMMDFDPGIRRFSNFKILVTEPNTPCNTTFHPSQPCYNVSPVFLPNDTGIVFEKEVFHNGNVGAASNPLSDFSGTRSGCDVSDATCNNDGTKGELWWTNISGAIQPRRLNAANGRNPDGSTYLPVSSDVETFCRVSGFACTTNAQCCSGTCSNSRCTAVKSPAGAACSNASTCESNACISGRCGCSRNADCATGSCNLTAKTCPSNNYYAPPTMSYQPGHNAVVEPVLNYKPTMNPTPTVDANGNPEYYWMVFTSRRMFGNIATINPWWSDPRRRDISQRVTPKKLWVAAIRANPTSGSDPSFPAFYLPGQEWIAGNAKAYWVQDACVAGSLTRDASTECESSADCCSGSVCQLEVPVGNPAKRHCVPTSVCVDLGGTCSTSSDCCSGRLCSNGTCQDPPPIHLYGSSATFTRDLSNSCRGGERPVWRSFDYQAILPAGTSIVFRARTAATPAELETALPLVTIGTANPPSTTGWTSFPDTIESLFNAAGARSLSNLRIEMQLNPSTDQTIGPTLTNWRTTVDCVPSE